MRALHDESSFPFRIFLTCRIIEPYNALVQLQAHLPIARGARYRKVLGILLQFR